MKASSEKRSIIVFTFAVFSVLLCSVLFVLWQTRRVQTQDGVLPVSSVDAKIMSQTEALARPGKKQVKEYTTLAALYFQKIRETADPSYYSKVDELLDQASALDATDSSVPALRAVLENGRHHFKEGYALITQAIAANPNIVSYYGIRADTEIELGKYAEAETSLQKMADSRPDFSSYTRIAYLRELYGDTEGAKEVLTLAISAGSPYKENIAWAYVELGKLQFKSDISLAEASFNRAREIEEEYPLALEGLARVAFARGNKEQAIKDAEAAFKKIPLAQYATLLGELYESKGNTTSMAQSYTLAKIAYERSASSGVDTDLEYALFLSLHGDKTLALSKAKEAYAKRPSVYGADVLAWAYYKNEQFKEAQAYSKEALRLGDNDPLLVFHAGMIALANNDAASAKTYFTEANELNPHFSIIYSDVLQSKLKNP